MHTQKGPDNRKTGRHGLLLWLLNYCIFPPGAGEVPTTGRRHGDLEEYGCMPPGWHIKTIIIKRDVSLDNVYYLSNCCYCYRRSPRCWLQLWKGAHPPPPQPPVLFDCAHYTSVCCVGNIYWRVCLVFFGFFYGTLLSLSCNPPMNKYQGGATEEFQHLCWSLQWKSCNHMYGWGT